MTNEEAHEITQKSLEEGRMILEAFSYGYLYAVEEALEKQIAQKPETRYGITYYCPPDCGGKEFDEYGDILICPSCRKDIEDDKYCKHCKECGQAIDWSEKE